MKAVRMLSALLALLTFASAWPWPPSLPEVGSFGEIEDILDRRQEIEGDGGQRNNDDSSIPASATSNDGEPVQTNKGDSDSATPRPKITPRPTETGKGSDDDEKSSSGGRTTRSVAQNAGAGGIQMITPAATAATSAYYSVGTTITWAWNYTSLVNPPQKINILATVAPVGGQIAPAPYTIDTNVTWNKLQNYTWDTGEFAEKTALPNNLYTLIVYDAEVSGGMTAIPRGGSLGVNKQFHFGIYNGNDYTALSNPYICATCNAAMGRMERLTLWSVLGIAGITVASFTWFVVGWGTV